VEEAFTAGCTAVFVHTALLVYQASKVYAYPAAEPKLIDVLIIG
jgi:hypothetical protein